MRSKANGRRKERMKSEEQRIVKEGFEASGRVIASEEDVFVVEGGVCPWTRRVVVEEEGTERERVETCPRAAGFKTEHEGVGYCYQHGGNSKREKKLGALIMAHAIARELDVTPWDALLVAVRRFAAMAAYYDSLLSGVVDDEDLLPGGQAYFWLTKSELMHEKAAKFAKMAIDAGVAERLVHQIELEGQQIVSVLNAALGALRLSQADEDRARHALATALREHSYGIPQIEA